MLARLRPVFFSLPSHGMPSVKLRILENFTLYPRNSLSLNLRALENCICGLRSIGRKMRSILRTVWKHAKSTREHNPPNSLARDPPFPAQDPPGRTWLASLLPPPPHGSANGAGGRGQGAGPAHPRILNRYFSFLSPFHEWLHILV